MGYYNGIVFQGFIKGLADGVLSGGRYDKLVEKMGKSFGAIGFAITLNELERLKPKSRDYDADVLLLYDEGTDLVELTQKGAELLEQGLQIMVQRGSPQRIRCRDILDLRRGGEAQ
jgi:ATP phosphoribosyltransferase regulatory subunit